MATDIRARVETFGVGWWAALIVGLVAVIMGFMGMLSKEWAMLIIAACSIRL